MLGAHGFTATSDDGNAEHDLLVTLTDGDTTRVNLHGAPAAVLDATLRAARTPPDTHTVVGVCLGSTPVAVGAIHGDPRGRGALPDGCWARTPGDHHGRRTCPYNTIRSRISDDHAG